MYPDTQYIADISQHFPLCIGVTDGTFSHPYVYINGLAHLVPYLQQVETMASYIMTRRLTELLTTLNCIDCPVTYWTTIITVQDKVPTQHYSVFPLQHYKSPPEAYPKYARLKRLLHLLFSLKVLTHFVPDLGFRGCARTTCSDIFYARKKLAQSLVVGQELSPPQPRENLSSVDLTSTIMCLEG